MRVSSYPHLDIVSLVNSVAKMLTSLPSDYRKAQKPILSRAVAILNLAQCTGSGIELLLDERLTSRNASSASKEGAGRMQNRTPHGRVYPVGWSFVLVSEKGAA